MEDKRTHINTVSSDVRGSTLHLAAKAGYLPICQILLLKGVDLAIRDGNGLLAKQVTSNAQIRNLIEKYEEQKHAVAHSEQRDLVFEEIKEGDEEEDGEEGTGMMRSHMKTSQNDEFHGQESPRDASGGMMSGGGYLPTMSGGVMSPSPQGTSPIMFIEK
jgi:Ankyrin repeats (many copies)